MHTLWNRYKARGRVVEEWWTGKSKINNPKKKLHISFHRYKSSPFIYLHIVFFLRWDFTVKSTNWPAVNATDATYSNARWAPNHLGPPLFLRKKKNDEKDGEGSNRHITLKPSATIQALLHFVFTIRDDDDATTDNPNEPSLFSTESNGELKSKFAVCINKAMNRLHDKNTRK